MIQIALKSTEIPVEIGELKFKVGTDDKSIQRILENMQGLEGVEERFKGLDNNQAIVELGKLLKLVFDSTLEDGAYDKIYQQTPSVSLLADYYLQLAVAVTEEYKKRNKSEKMKKYLNK